MKKEVLKISAALCVFSMLFAGNSTVSYVSASTDDSLEDSIELVEIVTSDGEEDLEVEDITDEELLEAEPSELPKVEEDEELTKKLMGRMLLDVEGNGEVYYIDPVTGGKEYLADGESAQLLLKRRSLGINEENFAKLTIGEEKDEESVCETSDLSRRLKGRIVLRTEENGEAYWIYPENCRAYYAGTFEASYELMKKFSLGIAKKNLAKIRNNKRQNMKNALRVAVYAHAEDNDMTLEEAREDLKTKVESVKVCMADFRDNQEEKPTAEQHRERARTCSQGKGMPKINKERKQEIKEVIKETRQERKGNGEGDKKELGDIDIKKVFTRVKNVIKNRVQNMKENKVEMKECIDGKADDLSALSEEEKKEIRDECAEELGVNKPVTRGEKPEAEIVE